MVVGESVTQLDVGDVLAFDEHVRLEDSVGLGIEFLAESTHDGLRIELVYILHAGREEASSTCCWIVDGADDAGLGEGVVVFHEYEGSGKAYNVSWGEVFSGGFIGAFSKAAYQLFEDEAHVVIRDRLGAEVSGADLLDDLVEEVGVVELGDKFGELEMLEDLAGILGEALQIGVQIVLEACLTQL